MALKCSDIEIEPQRVTINAKIRVTFRITGAMPVPFQFPFSNESLTERKIEFLEDDLYGDTA